MGGRAFQAGRFLISICDQRLDVLANWLGTTMTGSSALHTARRICLSAGNSGVSLYYIRVRDGVAYRCDTALSYNLLNDRTGEYLPDGSVFNFEMETPFELVNRYLVIPPGQLSVSLVTAGILFKMGPQGMRCFPCSV
jgi:hypothetical protein